MNDTLLYNNGLELLEQFLQKWLLDNNEDTNSENYKIFLPKTYYKDSDLMFAFPIYKIEERKCKLISWIIFNVSNNEPDTVIDNWIEVYNNSLIDFDFEMVRGVIESYYNLFILELNTNRLKSYSELLEVEKRKVKAYEEEYKTELENLRFKEYDLNLYETIEAMEKKNITEEVDIPKLEVKEKTDYEYALEMLAENNSENRRYEFEWKTPHRLKYVSDDALELAYLFLKYGQGKIKNAERMIKDSNGNPMKEKYWVFESNIKGFCNFDDTTLNDLKEQLKKDGSASELFNYKGNEFAIYNYSSFDFICFGCKFQTCPKMLAAYILYLKNNDMLEDALVERHKFIEETQNKNSFFRFKWNVKEGLKYVDEDIFKYAEELVKRNIVYIKTLLRRNGNVEICSALGCQDFKAMNAEISKLPNKVDYKAPRNWLERKTQMERFEFCNAYTCLLNACPYEVAGYIYYLIHSGQEKQIEEDRLYYAAHKEEIDKQNQLRKEQALEKIANNKNNILERFGEYKNTISNIKNLVDELSNYQTFNMHCFVQCDDEVERNKFIDKIFNELKNSGKIIRTRDMSLQNFTVMNAHYMGGEYKDKDGKVLRDRKGTAYVSEREVRYTLSEEKTLYILDNITEFIKDYNIYKKENKDYQKGELKKKQFEHVIKLLTCTSNSYFILVGTEDEKERLLALDSRLKYIYGNYVYAIPGLSIDEMFKIYKNNIKPQLINQFREKEELYKKQFSEYVSLNKSFIPFSDRELVIYLANYTNSKDTIEFPDNVYKKETVEESLRNIVGLQNVKGKLKEFEKYMLFQMKAKANNMNLKSSNMHMIFTGNPGTGKTTVARIMAKMLYDLGMLKENKLVEVEKKDLVASYLGQTASKTSEVIEKALGGVLFIDEAYSLTEDKDPYGKEAMATLIKAMEDKKDELVVIFAGYKNEMKTFLDSNSGIASRIGYTFDFSDYSADELVEIFNLKMINMGFEIEASVNSKVKNICEYFTKRKDFGNGRFIDKLIQEIIIKHSNDDNAELKKITYQDIPEIEQLTISSNTYNNVDVKEQFDSIVGMNHLKEKIKEFTSYIKFVKDAQNMGINIPEQNMHMVFTGNPGTGKTTVARIVAHLLFDMGFIHENKLLEVERKDLIASYVGQTAPKTSEVIEKAMGGVLFIDEAYSLTQGNHSSNDYGSEAIATLIKAMEDHKGEFIVIFAGYKDEMKNFIESNPGIASRVGYTFDFPDYSSNELEEIFYRKVSALGFKFDDSVKERVHSVMQYFESVENIGNGRFVDKVVQNTLLKMAQNRSVDLLQMLPEHIPTIKEMTDTLLGGKDMIDPTKITEESLKKTAAHEVGHATVTYLLTEKLGIKKITVKAEGMGTLGYVKYKEQDEYLIYKKSFILNRIKTCLAGMVAEAVYFGEHANGNTSDLEQATNYAYNMITKYGMSDLGYAQIKNPEGEVAKLVFIEQNKILKACYDETYELIKKYKKNMDYVVEYLLKEGEITEEEFIEVFNKNNKFVIDKNVLE